MFKIKIKKPSDSAEPKKPKKSKPVKEAPVDEVFNPTEDPVAQSHEELHSRAPVAKDRGPEDHHPDMVAAAELVNTEDPQDQLDMSISGRRSLPVLTDGEVDVAREKAKQGILPQFGCSQCHIANECPEFAEGYVCAFNDAFKALPTRDVQSILENMRQIVQRNSARLQRAFYAEDTVERGQTNPMVTRLSEQVLAQMNMLLKMQEARTQVKVSVKGNKAVQQVIAAHSFTPTAAVELRAQEAQTITQERKGGGILSALFGVRAQQVPEGNELTINPESAVQRDKVIETAQQDVVQKESEP